jgi:hypothetical protein
MVRGHVVSIHGTMCFQCLHGGCDQASRWPISSLNSGVKSIDSNLTWYRFTSPQDASCCSSALLESITAPWGEVAGGSALHVLRVPFSC